MFKKTLLASALTLTFALGAQGVQANPVTNLVDGLLDGFTSQQFDARRGGGARRTSTVRRSSTTTSSSTTKSTTPTTTTNNNTTASSTNNTTASGTNNTTGTTGTTGTNTTGTNQQDANFSQRAYTGNQPNQPTQYGNQPYGNQPYGNQYGGQMGGAPSGGLGMGATFVSSLAGAGAGVLLANMLLSPAAAAEQGTEIATPDMLSDDQIKDLLAEVETNISDAETRLKEATEEEKGAISDELSKLHALQVSLMKEQINRIQNG